MSNQYQSPNVYDRYSDTAPTTLRPGVPHMEVLSHDPAAMPLARESIGVGLNSERHLVLSWIQLTPLDDSVKLLLHSPKLPHTPGLHPGPSGTVLNVIGPNDSLSIGRDNFRGTDRYVSNRHLTIRTQDLGRRGLNAMGVLITDEYSANGSSIWVDRIDPTEHFRSQSDRRASEQADHSEDTQFVSLIDQYAQKFPVLDPVHFGILNNFIKANPKSKDPKALRRELIKVFHPDKNLTGNPDQSHSLYLLACDFYSIV